MANYVSTNTVCRALSGLVKGKTIDSYVRTGGDYRSVQNDSSRIQRFINWLAQCIDNHQIKIAIKRALISATCDSGIKRKIFENIMNIEQRVQNERRIRSDTPVDISYIKAINELLDEIRKSGCRIILDNTDFSSVNLSNLDLTNSSAVKAKFNSMNMDHVVWRNVDFSDAQFFSSEIRHCHFDHVTFRRAIFMKCKFWGGLLCDVTILKSRFYEAHFCNVLVPQLESDDEVLREIIRQSEICETSKIPSDLVIGDWSNSVFYEEGRCKTPDLSENQFVHILNSKHTSCDDQVDSILTLRTSFAVGEAVPIFPVYVTELISKYACDDIMLAEQPLKSNFRKVIDCEENQTIKSAIKKALVSEDCSPEVKRAIFRNIMNFTSRLQNIVTASSNLSQKERLGENSYVQVINELLNEIRASKNRIILDYTDFTNIDLSCLDLTGATAISAKFGSMQMKYLKWQHGDFSGAQFDAVTILQCRFKHSIFNKSVHRETVFYLTELTQTHMNGVEFYMCMFDGVFANRLVTDDVILMKKIVKARLTLGELAQIYSDPEVFTKSLSIRLIFQYANEEGTESVNFLTGKFTTARQLERNSVEVRGLQ